MEKNKRMKKQNRQNKATVKLDESAETSSE